MEIRAVFQKEIIKNLTKFGSMIDFQFFHLQVSLRFRPSPVNPPHRLRRNHRFGKIYREEVEAARVAAGIVYGQTEYLRVIVKKA